MQLILTVELCCVFIFLHCWLYSAGSEAECMGAVVSGKDTRDSRQRTRSVEKSCISECCRIIFMDQRSISGRCAPLFFAAGFYMLLAFTAVVILANSSTMSVVNFVSVYIVCQFMGERKGTWPDKKPAMTIPKRSPFRANLLFRDVEL